MRVKIIWEDENGNERCFCGTREFMPGVSDTIQIGATVSNFEDQHDLGIEQEWSRQWLMLYVVTEHGFESLPKHSKELLRIIEAIEK